MFMQRQRWARNSSGVEHSCLWMSSRKPRPICMYTGSNVRTCISSSLSMRCLKSTVWLRKSWAEMTEGKKWLQSCTLMLPARGYLSPST
jgi:hypothetical protein